MRSEEECRVLIVEDQSIVAWSIADALRRAGVQTCVALNGREAMQRIESHVPELAILDIKLTGGISGIQIAKRLRQNAEVPIVFVSGVDDGVMLARARRLRPIALFTKPFDLEQILAVCRGALANWH